jgi:D-alanine-D-alanine ligase
MNYLDKKTYEKIKNLHICLITGTGTVNRKDKADLVAEEDAFVTARELLALMLKEGFKYVDYFTATDDNLPALQFLKPDVFLNLAEGVKYEFCDRVFAHLEKTNIPVTGTINAPTTDKIKTKITLEKNKISTPRAFFLEEKILDVKKNNVRFPLIVKPALEDGSTGISDQSVVENENELQKCAASCFETYHEPVLVEEYIDGREFSVTFYQEKNEIKFLPVAELIFKPNAHKWNIYTYKAKWFYQSADYARIPTLAPPKNLSPHDEEMLKNVCRKAFTAFKLYDFARIDFRFDEINHIPYVIDINANPSLEIDKNYSLSVSVDAAGLNMAQFTALIIKSAIERKGKKI